MQASLHEQLALALPDQLDRLGGGRVAVRHVENSKRRDVEIVVARDFCDFLRRADEGWNDDTRLGSLDGAAQRRLIARVHDDGCRGLHLLGECDEAFVFGVGRSLGRRDRRNRHRKTPSVVDYLLELFFTRATRLSGPRPICSGWANRRRIAVWPVAPARRTACRPVGAAARLRRSVPDERRALAGWPPSLFAEARYRTAEALELRPASPPNR